MKKNSEDRLRKYVDALEKTNKNLMVALKAMHKYSYTLEKTKEDLLNKLDSHAKFSRLVSFGKESDEFSTPYRLMELIMDMSDDEQKNLLKQLAGETSENEGRHHFRKPFFMNVDYATQGRNHNDFITDISAGGLFIETNRPFFIGQDIVLSFPFPNHNRHVKVAGEIVRTAQQGIGVRFKLDHQDEQFAKSLVETV